ncbi:MAG: recombinase [Desulfobulbus propionicus]|nr:MAG: recombinase [Desulfobulbus propionicus]
MEDKQPAKPSWQDIQEKKINMAKERGARVLKVNSPLGSTMFDKLRQFDMAYTHFKARLGEMDGISHEEGEELMAEGREIVMAFSNYTAKLSKRIRFRYYTPREIKAFIETEPQKPEIAMPPEKIEL